MPELAQMQCEACNADSPRVAKTEITALMPHIPDWALVERDGMQRLERVYRFKDFAAALAFTNKIGEIAEQEGHHPALLTEWGRTTVAWWTHSIGGIHRNDFIMAAKSDQLYALFAGK